MVLVACLIFLASYNPRTGNLTKFFAPETSVDGPRPSRAAQSDRDTDEQSE